MMTDVFNAGASAAAVPVAGEPTASAADAPPPAADQRVPEPRSHGPRDGMDNKDGRDDRDSKEGKDGEATKTAPTAREALKRAAEKLARAAAGRPDQAAHRPDPARATSDRPGDRAAMDGKAVTAEPAGQRPGDAPSRDAPARFSADAKAAWATAPDPVKAEVHRAIRELEQGHEKYRADAEAFSQVKEFDQLARQNNTSLREAMTRYLNLEHTLLTDPMAGIRSVCDYAGVSLGDLAAAVIGQAPDQLQTENDATIRALRQEISSLKHQIGGVTSSLEQQQRSGIETAVDAFASRNPRFEELADDIVFFIESGRTNDLAEAYRMADRLNPAPSASAPAAPAAAYAADLAAQTRKGSKSVFGAPTLGSDPASGKRSTSIRDSLSRAVARAR